MYKRISLLALSAFMVSTAASIAAAADLPPPPPAPAPQIRATAADWTGPYFGGVIGGTCMDTDTAVGIVDLTANTPSAPQDPALNGCGVSGGLVGGFNYQFGNVVAGLEGDFTWGSDKTGQHTDVTGAGDLIGEYYNVKWMASIRPRVGWLMNDDTLFYVTGGPAWMKGEMEDIITSQKVSKTHFGYAIGGGMEHALTENIHLRAEYMFSSYNKKDYVFTCPGGGAGCADPNGDGDDGYRATARNDMDQFHTFRIGVTWNFPVSAW